MSESCPLHTPIQNKPFSSCRTVLMSSARVYSKEETARTQTDTPLIALEDGAELHFFVSFVINVKLRRGQRWRRTGQ